MQLKQRALIPVILTMVALSIYSFHQLMWSNGSDPWHGAFFATAALPTYMALFLAKSGAARTSSLLLPVQVVTIIGVVLAASGALAFLTAFLGLIGLEWFVFAYSRYRRGRSEAIVLGRPLPDLTFDTLDGTRVRTSDFIGSQTLLVFFRGNWCPLCMAQLRELTVRADQLAAVDVQVRFISNQGVARSRELAATLELPDHFEVLDDRKLAAAERLGIADIGGTPPGLKDYPADTVMATVIALDAEGCVIFGDQTDNYRVRPHPDVFLPVFDGRMKAGALGSWPTGPEAPACSFAGQCGEGGTAEEGASGAEQTAQR